MSLWFWFIGGVAVGFLNAISLYFSVEQLRPETSVIARVSIPGGMVVRFGMIVLLLLLAVQQSALSALVAFLGLMLARWAAIGFIYFRAT